MVYFLWEKVSGGWRFVATHPTRRSAQRQAKTLHSQGIKTFIGDHPPVARMKP